MSDAPFRILTFPDRRQRGQFPVTDADGILVAQISASWTGMSFVAHDATDRPLCAGSVRWLGLSPSWRVTGPDGQALLTVTRRFMGSSAAIRLERGGELVMRGSAWRRDFEVTSDGAPVLSATPRTSSFSLRQHDYSVAQTRPVLQLPEIVALVQIWRMVKKSDSAAAGAAAGASGTA